MIQRVLVKILLAPLSLLYGVGVGMRNLFYKWGLLKSIEFNLPVINVGNLSVGGAGKTPHIEYLVRLLKDHLEVATLSRGYQRKSRGFLVVDKRMNAEQVGDEPLQYKRKFPEALVTVGEERAFAVPKILQHQPETQVVLLDDAFQHRAIKPGLNVLLTEYHHPFTEDHLLPMGRLREWRAAYARADAIIVSKCPAHITEVDRERFRQMIKPLPHQKLFFSYYAYGAPYYMFNPRYRLKLDQEVDTLLICAIARTEYLTDYLLTQAGSVHSLEYADHHFFSGYDIGNLDRTFKNLDSQRKAILTTEKDAMRLELHRDFLLRERLPIFVVPVEVRFHFDEGPVFDEWVRQFLLNFKV